VVSFSVAVSRRWKSQEGEAHEAADWFNVEAWEHLAEFCKQYLTKGSLVYISGPLRTDRYEHQGETRYFTKVIARRLLMLDRKPEEKISEPVDYEEDVLEE